MLCGRLPQYAPALKLAFDLLTLKVVSESHVMWATSVPIFVFLGLSVLDLGPNIFSNFLEDPPLVIDTRFRFNYAFICETAT